MITNYNLQIGIIGGTGMDDPDILKNREEKQVSTPYGEVYSYLYCFIKFREQW